jgi:carbonic anhydrase
MNALLHRDKVAGMPSVNSWLRYAERAEAVVQHNSAHLPPDAVLEALIEENVLAQLDNLRTHPCVASRLKSGTLSLHGWIFDIETGRIRSYDPERKQFVRLRAEAAAAARGQLEGAHA